VARQYQPRRFFRNAPNRLLQQYFSGRGVLAEVDFGTLTETQVEPVYEAWLTLPEDVRNAMEQDFQEIDELACEGGSKAILDEARFHGEDLAEQFAGLDGFHGHAFWTFLECPKCWRGAVALHHADTVPASYWRKRKNLPRQPAAVDAASISKFEQNLGDYFHWMQGRGKNCKVDCYRRDDLDYFFAYPEDYAQASPEWEGKEFKRRPHHPAFEIIFVYAQQDGTLDIFLSGDRKPVPDLQAIFAAAILKAELEPDEKDERVYDLNPLRFRQFQFSYQPESGIERVDVKKLRLAVRGKSERLVLEADPTRNPQAVFDLLAKVTTAIPLAQLSVTQVGIKVTFAPSASSRKANTRTFDITWPNSCSLKHDGRDLIIRRMLADSGIELQEPAPEEGGVAA
jgi:hypothetical protein